MADGVASPTELAARLPADVLAFAVEQGVDEYLPSLLEMTHRVFPSARRSGVRDQESEVPDARRR
jgi:hypothetical protein